MASMGVMRFLPGWIDVISSNSSAIARIWASGMKRLPSIFFGYPEPLSRS